MSSKPALPMLALALSACASKPTAVAADRGAGRAAALPGLPAAPGGADQAAGQDRLPDADRLIATEQAIQLDELIKWVKAQAVVKRD